MNVQIYKIFLAPRNKAQLIYLSPAFLSDESRPIADELRLKASSEERKMRQRNPKCKFVIYHNVDCGMKIQILRPSYLHESKDAVFHPFLAY